jgi:hypothetical protein
VDARPRTAQRSSGAAAIAAVLLLLAAALSFGLSSAFARLQRHAFDSGPAPSTVRLTAGRTYQLSVDGGRGAITAAGGRPDQPQCTWSSGPGGTQPLAVSPLSADADAVNAVATFVAPASGRVHIECAGWDNVFVDDADGAAFDRGGLFLVVGVVASSAGLALGLGVLYRRRTGERASRVAL